MTQSKSLEELEGQPETAVFAELGQPAQEETFPLTTSVSEFRIELLNLLPQSKASNVGVPVRELTWEGDMNKTLWLIEQEGVWTVVDSLSWDPNTDF